MRTPTINALTVVFGLTVLLSGCESALYFYETDKISLTAEARPDTSQPVQGNLGVKERVVLIAPKKGDADDAVSSINSFNFKIIPEPGTIFNPVLIQTAFITGNAASGLTLPQASAAAEAITLGGTDISSAEKLAGEIAGEIASETDRAILKDITLRDFSALTDRDYQEILRLTALQRKSYTAGLHEALRKKLAN